MAFWIRDFQPLPEVSLREFPLMADVHVAVDAHRRHIPIRVLRHPGARIRPSGRLDSADSIFANFKDRDTRHVERLNHVARGLCMAVKTCGDSSKVEGVTASSARAPDVVSSR